MADDTLLFIAAIIGGYLLGSVPFGLVLTHLAGLGDIRNIGSGNIGATNVLRTGRKDLALATLLLDSGKGAIAVLVAAPFGPTVAAIAGASAFLGHLFPVWLRFQGGKGVATFLGTLIALAWPAGLLACATWAVTAFITRYSSLSALIAAGLSPFYVVAFGAPAEGVGSAAMAVLIFFRHRANIARLRRGEEPKIGKKETGP